MEMCLTSTNFTLKKNVYSSAFCKRFVVFFFCWVFFFVGFFFLFVFFFLLLSFLGLLACLFYVQGEFKIQCWGLSCLYFFGVPRGGIVPGL